MPIMIELMESCAPEQNTGIVSAGVVEFSSSRLLSLLEFYHETHAHTPPLYLHADDPLALRNGIDATQRIDSSAPVRVRYRVNARALPIAAAREIGDASVSRPRPEPPPAR